MKISKIFYLILLITIFFRPVAELYQHRESMFGRTYNYELYKHLYYSSQYVKKDHPNFIPDQTLEGFIAGALLHGYDSIDVIHDQPPLGRYINAFSILIFDNVSTISKLLLLASLVGLILISIEVIGNKWLAFLPVAIFSNESLFLSKTSLSFIIETLQLSFIIFCIYFFIKGIKKSSGWFFLCSLMLGAVISVRYFVLGGAILCSFLVFFILRRKYLPKIKIFLLSLPSSLAVLFVTYFKTIQDGHSLLDIIKIQKYIFVYHKSALTLPFSFWDLLLLDRWHTWWGNYAILKDSDWNFLWPTAFTISILGLVARKVKLSDPQLIIFLWLIFYGLMLSFGYSSTRYFLPFVPFLYIFAISFIRVGF